MQNSFGRPGETTNLRRFINLRMKGVFDNYDAFSVPFIAISYFISGCNIMFSSNEESASPKQNESINSYFLCSYHLYSDWRMACKLYIHFFKSGFISIANPVFFFFLQNFLTNNCAFII